MARLTSAARSWTKALLRTLLPLPVRQHLARTLGGRDVWPGRWWWSMELLQDWSERDPDAFHRFLWRHHLAYAESYEAAQRFGSQGLHPSRAMLFEDLRDWLGADRGGLHGDGEVRSVFEVGCSLGYLLRHLEVTLFRGAEVLEGIDIDARAVEEGTRWLRAERSRVQIRHGDMASLSEHLRGRRYDLFLCAGVLMYLTEVEAQGVVEAILRHTGQLAVFAGLAAPDADNASLLSSRRRPRDRTWIHNIDTMVREAGGTVLWRRWEGPRQVGGNTIYFVFARPGA